MHRFNIQGEPTLSYWIVGVEDLILAHAVLSRPPKCDLTTAEIDVDFDDLRHDKYTFCEMVGLASTN